MNKLLQAGAMFFSSVLLQIHVLAQEQQTDKAIQVFDTLKQAYQNATGLSFDVKYTYTNETKPDNVLDSLSGKFEISQDNYRYLLDSTETIHNDKYTIILFREDKIMYLTKPSLAVSANPIEAIGEFFKNNKDVSCQLNTAHNTKVLSIHYPPGMVYKQINLTIDTATGYLVKAEYIVQTKLLMETQPQDEQANQNQYDEYARVEADFSNYKIGSIDSNEFDENRFFQRDGKNFKTTDPYKTYKIFIGSSNL